MTFSRVIYKVCYKHLKQSKTCSQKYSPNCFKILDTAKSPILLKLKEVFSKTT